MPPASTTGGGTDRVRLALVAESDIQVCAVDAAGNALVDAQLLTAGTRVRLGRSEPFSIDPGAGQARLIVDGVCRSFDLNEPESFEVTATGIANLPFSGPDCP